jgi:hypothetical protein
VDRASLYIHVEHQFGFSAVETIRAKQSYVQDYITDSGAFKANKFVKHIHDIFCNYVIQMHIIRMELLRGLFGPSEIWQDQ